MRQSAGCSRGGSGKSRTSNADWSTLAPPRLSIAYPSPTRPNLTDLTDLGRPSMDTMSRVLPSQSSSAAPRAAQPASVALRLCASEDGSPQVARGRSEGEAEGRAVFNFEGQDVRGGPLAFDRREGDGGLAEFGGEHAGDAAGGAGARHPPHRPPPLPLASLVSQALVIHVQKYRVFLSVYVQLPKTQTPRLGERKGSLKVETGSRPCVNSRALQERGKGLCGTGTARRENNWKTSSRVEVSLCCSVQLSTPK